MAECMLGGRAVTVRPLTVGDVCALGEQWAAALAALGRLNDAGPAAWPSLLPALAPCLCRMSGLTAEELAALPLPEALALLRAAGEVSRPFPPPQA